MPAPLPALRGAWAATGAVVAFSSARAMRYSISFSRVS